MSDCPLLLIVRQRPAFHPELDKLVKELQASFQLDPYITRQRLIGPGLAQLEHGVRECLEDIATTLRRYGFSCWVTPQVRPAFVPQRLRGLTMSADSVEFYCDGVRTVRLERGLPAVGILADLSGDLAGQQLKRLLIRNAYLGHEHARIFTPDEVRQAIFKGQPVYDCYLLNQTGEVETAFRAFPGRFDPDGLGRRASLSAVRNLEAVHAVVSEYAGSYRIYTDFGLSQLPGCLPRSSTKDPSVLLENLDALTRYGWLVAGLTETAEQVREAVFNPDRPDSSGREKSGPVMAEVFAATAMAQREPEATATQGAKNYPLEEGPLPPPPEPPPKRNSQRWAGMGIATLTGGLLLACFAKCNSLRLMMLPLFHVGLLPALAAAALCWMALAWLRLKRRIEDTPTSRLRSLAMGLVEVKGRALRCHALVSPMSQSPCAWYRLRKYRRDSGNRWSIVSSNDSGHVPFLLDDGSGQIIVDPSGAKIRPAARQTGYSGSEYHMSSLVEDAPDEKWVEELIFEGTTLYVLGYARPVNIVESRLRKLMLDALRRLKLDPQALSRYDADGDGRLDADEWQVAREQAERLAAAETLSGRSDSLKTSVMLGRPPRGLPFLISEAQTDNELTRKYGWAAAVSLALGTVLAGVSLMLFLQHMRLA